MAPYLQVRTLVGWLAAVQTLGVLGLAVVAIVQNIHSPRYVEGCCPE